jgi:curved DNA-binding protein CbpA
MDEEFKRQITGLSKVIDDLDYYQILKLDQIAFEEDIKAAYFRESRLYHPDKFFNEPHEVQLQVNTIFKRVLEAYKVLMDKDRRALYTKNISGPDRKKYLRFDLRHLKQEAEKKEDEGQTPMGKKYYIMAKTAIQNKDYKGAKINLQLAAKMEPRNETFKEKLAEVESILKARKGL